MRVYSNLPFGQCGALVAWKRCARIGRIVLILIALCIPVSPFLIAAQPNWGFNGGNWTDSHGVISQLGLEGRGLALSSGMGNRYSARVQMRVSLSKVGAAAGLLLQA